MESQKIPVHREPPEKESFFSEESRPDRAGSDGVLSQRPAAAGRHRPALWNLHQRLGGLKAAQGIAARIAFVLPFLGLLTWFRVADVYHLQFFARQSNWAYLVHNCFRALYSLYLIWLLCYVGGVLLRALDKRGNRLGVGPLGEVVLCFYAGAAITNVAAFLLGCLHLYYYWLLAPITVLLLAASYRSFVGFVDRAAARSQVAQVPDKDAVKAGVMLLTLGAVIFIAVLLLVMKALPPGGGHDYYAHYFPYFNQVVRSHGLAPNDVWYHYYVSKGAALVFWSLVLTDPQAPEIVTYAFVLIAGLATCSIVRQWCGNSILALAAMGVFLAAFVTCRYDGDPVSWGQFQKHHEQTASLITSLGWLALVMPSCAGSTLRTWSVFASLFAANTVLFAPTAYPLVVVLLALGMLGWALRRQWRMIKCFAAAIVTATAMLGSLLALNYWTTGLAEITPMRFFWKYADQERFSRLWSPYLMVLLLEGSSPEMGNAELTLPRHTSVWQFTSTLLRCNHLSAFFPRKIYVPCLWLIIGLFLIRRKRLPFDLARSLLFILGFLAASALIGCASGQHVSAFRYFSFAVFFVNLFAVLTWVSVFELLVPRALFARLAYILPGVFVCWIAFATLVKLPTDELTHSVMFALGRESLAGNLASHDPGAVFGPAVRATNQLPAGSRVYTFNHLLYSMAPNTELESFVSHALGPRWHEIMFEPPERARAALQEQRLNYFLIDLGSTVLDTLPYAPLFSADHVANYLQLAWNEGDVYLLTWPGPDTRPLPESFLARYRDNTSQGNRLLMTDLRPLYERVRSIYETNKGKPYPIWRDPTFPPVQGWQ